MKVILDEGLPLEAARLLRKAGVDAKHVLELAMGGASDHEIIGRAEADQAIIITLDADFHQILATTGAAKPSVIRFRIEGLKPQPLSYLLSNVLTYTQNDLASGAMVSVDEKSIRVRRLPIGNT